MDAAARRLVRQRDGQRCEYCRLRKRHWFPFLLGGTLDLEESAT